MYACMKLTISLLALTNYSSFAQLQFKFSPHPAYCLEKVKPSTLWQMSLPKQSFCLREPSPTATLVSFKVECLVWPFWRTLLVSEMSLSIPVFMAHFQYCSFSFFFNLLSGKLSQSTKNTTKTRKPNRCTSYSDLLEQFQRTVQVTSRMTLLLLIFSSTDYKFSSITVHSLLLFILYLLFATSAC